MKAAPKHKNPQISFRIDEELKARLADKIRRNRLNLTEFFRFCAEAYLNSEITVSIIGDEDAPPRWLLKNFKSRDRVLLSEAAFLLKRIRASSRQEMREEIEENRPA